MADPIPYEDIVDDVLRAELQSLGLTIPHIQSVLSPEIGYYDVPFYQKLLGMEAFTYELSGTRNEDPDGPQEGVAGHEEYSPYWTTFNEALLGYINHAPLPKQKVKDVVSGLFGFLTVHYGHGAGEASTIPQSNAKAIFVMNGFIETTLTRPLEYYDDYVPEDPMATPEPTMASAERLEGEPAVVETTWAGDAAKVDVLLGKYADAISDVAVNAIFENTDPDATGPKSFEAWDLIFIDLNWKWFIEQFNSTFVIPPRPLEPLTEDEEPQE